MEYLRNPSDEPIDVWYSDNETWSEEDIDPLCGDGIACDAVWNFFSNKLMVYPGGTDGAWGWDCFDNLSHGVNFAINNGSDSVSFILNHSGSTTDYYQWESKEATSGGDIPHPDELKPYINITYRTADPDLKINLDYPDNEASFEAGIIRFNWTPTGLNNSYNCNLSINGTNEIENLQVSNFTMTSQTVSLTKEGTYPWNVTCGNGSLVNTSSTRSVIIATNYSDIHFNTSFEGGNLMNVTFISGNYSGHRHYTAEMNYSTGTGYDTYQFWFYFGMNNTANKTIQLEITNCLQEDEDNNRWDRVKATYSFDNNLTWYRTTNTTTPGSNYTFQYDSANNNYQINVTPGENEEIFLASNYPYPYTRFMKDFLLSKNSSRFANVSLLGLSENGRNVTMITITDSNYNDSEKHKVFILGGQHVCGEEQGVWNSRGIIEYLLNETNETAARLRQDYIFEIVPLMDAFASVTGRGRYSLNWLDPNRQWNSTESDNLLPVNYTKKEIETFDPSIFLDLHGMITYEDNKIYYPNGGQSEESLMDNISQYWLETGSRLSQSTKGLASVAINDEFGILSLTIETAISDTSTTSTRTNMDWVEDGKNLIRGIYSYLGNMDASFINIAPDTPNSTISTPDGTNTTDSVLNCSSILSDSNVDTLNVTVKWYLNETLNITNYHNNSYPNGSLFNATISSSYTSPQDTWFCSMQSCDNHSNCTSWANSSTILILESLGGNTPASNTQSGSSGINYNIGDTANLDETKELKKNDKLIFTHNEETHWLKIENIKEEYIGLTIHSDPIDTNISIGESKDYDIDQEEGFDITLTLDSIANRRATLNIRNYLLLPATLGDCLTKWKCSDWGMCNGNYKERICLDENNCGTSKGKPIELVVCEQYSPEVTLSPFKENTPIWIISLLLIIITAAYVVFTKKR
jgi:hypothetical protein